MTKRSTNERIKEVLVVSGVLLLGWKAPLLLGIIVGTGTMMAGIYAVVDKK